MVLPVNVEDTLNRLCNKRESYKKKRNYKEIGNKLGEFNTHRAHVQEFRSSGKKRETYLALLARMNGGTSTTKRNRKGRSIT